MSQRWRGRLEYQNADDAEADPAHPISLKSNTIFFPLYHDGWQSQTSPNTENGRKIIFCSLDLGPSLTDGKGYLWDPARQRPWLSFITKRFSTNIRLTVPATWDDLAQQAEKKCQGKRRQSENGNFYATSAPLANQGLVGCGGQFFKTQGALGCNLEQPGK